MVRCILPLRLPLLTNYVDRLLEYAADYYNLDDPNFSGEAKKALQRLVQKKQGRVPASASGESDTRDKKKRKKDRK